MKKNIFTGLFALIFCMMMAVPIFAAGDLPRLVDDADLLTDREESALLSKLNKISERQQADIVVVTANTLNGKTPMDYADDFYDYNGYGIGSSRDGVLLLVSMEDRDLWISTAGYGITALTDAGIKYILDEFVSSLDGDDYAAAIQTYAELCDQFFIQAKAGKPYDVGSMPKEPFSIWINLLISLVVGFVIALIVTGIMKSQLKSVRFQSGASSYVKANSMNVTESRDLFLYRQVSRCAIPKESSSSGGGFGSGGSSTHMSSSGMSHGGGGRKF